MTSLTPLAIVDTETTGLTIGHDIWEIAVIQGNPCRDGSGYSWKEFLWHLKPDIGNADPNSVRINRLYERMALDPWKDNRAVPALFCPPGGEYVQQWRDPSDVAAEVASALAGRTVVGAVPNFDTERLEVFLRENRQCGAWYYHLVDVEALTAGYLMGLLAAGRKAQLLSESDEEVLLTRARPDWSSAALASAIGVDEPAEEFRHTALADCRWARDIYCKIMEISI